MTIIPKNPIANGTDEFIVIVTVRDRSGAPVQGANVRFVSEGYVRIDGNILGGDERKMPDVGYICLPSGGYVLPDGKLGNLLDVTTDSQGQAIARYRTPAWEEFMSKKPIVVGAWYCYDGGNQPFVSKAVFSDPMKVLLYCHPMVGRYWRGGAHLPFSGQRPRILSGLTFLYLWTGASGGER